ncbi:MAG: bifunctional hydroxymethylpyrimidine kinase/phosphomethylpyrimidine kinase [Endozoicomonas sp. (ex Botrylloides leachii)]|nr:bifunctional hydroxymethylpyrimidine kinase/phosphomethylpyrimidine kinase [Endozoicomonas sp. (ex Botrylloides leachii)]
MSPIALTIAGSDSGGGAGIQADIKTFSALGVYGCSVITALTAQNTLGVQGVFDIDPAFVARQIDSVLSDIAVDAVKIGMLSNQEIIENVSKLIERYQPHYLVVDPVMVATSGDELLKQQAIDSLKKLIIPKANIITPNLPEALVLLDCSAPKTLDDMYHLMDPLMALGAKTVLLKGGHLAGDSAIDLFHDGNTVHLFKSPRIKTGNTHGTGCTLSSAITALLAKGYTLTEAVSAGKDYITETILHGTELNIGQGSGPVNHFYRNS